MKSLVAALAKARAKFPAIEKTEKAEIRLKSGSGYSYDYAPLSEILDKITGPLAENELVLFEIIEEGESGTELVVTLAHSSGEMISSRKLMGTYNDPKDFGGAMTYYRRYLIEGLVNIASQQDKDAQGIESKTEPRRKPKQQPTQKQQRQPIGPEQLVERFRKYCNALQAKGNYVDEETGDLLPVTLHLLGDKTPKIIAAKMAEALGGDKDAYHVALEAITGKESANDLTAIQAAGLLKILFNGNPAEIGFDTPVLPTAEQELRAVVEAYQEQKDEIPF